MTGPEEPRSTRPISVAELLAKNGTIGAPPAGGRRRRRRGSDSVTVAELTGEIPIVDAESAPEATEPAFANGDDAPIDTWRKAGADEAGAVEATPDATPDPELADAEADYSAHLKSRDADPAPLDFQPRRSHYAHAQRRPRPAPPRPEPPRAEEGGSGAEQMSPDPVVDELADDLGDGSVLDSPVNLTERRESDYGESEASDADDEDSLPSYLRSSQGPLFGGQTVADDLARRGVETDTAEAAEDEDLDELEDDYADEYTEPSTFMRGAWIVGQCILAVAFGAGLFIAFDQLWKWNNIVALVLSVLVILGLVVAVRVVRKTEDIGSTLIAVAVGALITLGPLALLQSG